MCTQAKNSKAVETFYFMEDLSVTITVITVL